MAFVSHSWHFNPLPRKEGDAVLHVSVSSLENFNPLPRKEGDGVQDLYYSQVLISIHSLVKRETLRKRSEKLAFMISIHSLVKRETANFAKI